MFLFDSCYAYLSLIIIFSEIWWNLIKQQHLIKKTTLLQWLCHKQVSNTASVLFHYPINQISSLRCAIILLPQSGAFNEVSLKLYTRVVCVQIVSVNGYGNWSFHQHNHYNDVLMTWQQSLIFIMSPIHSQLIHRCNIYTYAYITECGWVIFLLCFHSK